MIKHQNTLFRTFLSAFAAARAFFRINGRQMIGYMNRVKFARFHAKTAADAGNTARLFRQRTFVLVAAGNL